MNANILGFIWHPNGGVTLAALFEHLAGLHNVEQKFGGFNRLIYVAESGTYHVGLFLTAKNHRRFCELHRQGEALRINVREAAKGSNLIDFNYFLVHRDTGRGFYLHYHNSCSQNQFSLFCRKQYTQLRTDQRAEEIVAAGGDDAPPKKLSEIEEKYEGTLENFLLVRPENFQTLVKRFRKISSFEFNLASVAAEQERTFRSIKGVARVIRHRIGFKRDATLAEIKDAIFGTVGPDNDIGEAAVHGEDEDGLEKVIALANNPDNFGHWPFDRMAETMGFPPEEFATSAVMQDMIRTANQNKHVLERPAR